MRLARRRTSPLSDLYGWLDGVVEPEPVINVAEFFEYGHVDDWKEYKDMLRAGRRWIADLLREWDEQDRLECEVLRKAEAVNLPEYVAFCHDKKTGKDFILLFDVEIVGDPDVDGEGAYYSIELLAIEPRPCTRGSMCEDIRPYYTWL